MHIALYQCPPLPLDIDANLARLRQQAATAARQGVQLLVCPEMFLTGYNIGREAVQRLAQPADGPAAAEVARIAVHSGVAIAYGYPERGADGRLYNAAQVIDAQGQRLGNYRKTHLFGELDHGMFSAGNAHSAVFELHGWKLGLLICYDVEFPENVRHLAMEGAELVVVPTANMQPYDFVCEVTVRARAFENQCYLAYANYCGAEGAIHYCGLSSLNGPDGHRPALAGAGEGLIHATLTRAAIAQAKGLNDYLADRRERLDRP
ncbi:carbon-nitrogen hydrolase family protein [Pseudomonas sp. DTU_2021_1001937_2_SI_NGA_ILE_001]|uniref:carbon-nitrogen hydrolase family protein n=1 Tax=Pseudomonas sp. DTU_2021_1001937_2_SI_NGA_ILE_001 TaxID=3077589 RepID=UPI0028FC112C|nr:carbon-nitrogen hydrolase family protein [Pseudomonas sp. DTU_2021_1001937_2_SI_NGA_ILE_001]WNW12188.1 carbon-nitrogen hydrolase family protein [Pseudomonas sp. DTU_2021_1001937_2_SI_NGA_ILE_001]